MLNTFQVHFSKNTAQNSPSDEANQNQVTYMEKKTKQLIAVIISSILLAIATSIVFSLAFVLINAFKYKGTLFTVSVVFLVLISITSIYKPFDPDSTWDAFLIAIYTIMFAFFGVITVVCILAFIWYLITGPE